MKLLILTDHSRHSQHNSVYRLAQAISQHESVSQLYISSRGDSRDHLFYNGQGDPSVHAIKYSAEFKYPVGELFKNTAELMEISACDAIFLRLPRPIAPNFFNFLQLNFNELNIINRPSGIVETSNKSFLLKLDQFVEPMALCSSWEDILEFKNEYDCVLKPLEEYGGRGIVRIENQHVNQDGRTIPLEEFYQTYLENPQPYLAMKYLKNVSQGDKRIVVSGGKILTTSLRIPADGNWLCNVAQGGSIEVSLPNEREREIVDYVQPIMLTRGIFYYGLDTLVNDEGNRIISEINTLSIGGIAPAELATNEPLANRFASQLISYLNF